MSLRGMAGREVVPTISKIRREAPWQHHWPSLQRNTVKSILALSAVVVLAMVLCGMYSRNKNRSGGCETRLRDHLCALHRCVLRAIPYAKYFGERVKICYNPQPQPSPSFCCALIVTSFC